jgi:phosphoglycolate phosphatase
MRFDGVIFDLDGTLVDTLEDIGEAMNRVLAAEGVPPHTYGEYRYLVGRGIGDLVSEALPAERRDETTVARCYEHMIADYGEHALIKTRAYDGVEELVRRLGDGHVPMAVFSNKADALTRHIVAHLLEAGAFAVVTGARPDRPLKPDPSVALDIAARFTLPPARIAYLGDSRVDMLTATAAGMLAIGATWGFREREELLESGALALIDRPLDLLGLRD